MHLTRRQEIVFPLPLPPRIVIGGCFYSLRTQFRQNSSHVKGQDTRLTFAFLSKIWSVKKILLKNKYRYHFFRHCGAFCGLKFGPLAPSRGCADCFVVIAVSIYLLNTTQSDNDNNNNNNNAITFQFVTYELRKDRRS